MHPTPDLSTDTERKAAQATGRPAPPPPPPPDPFRTLVRRTAAGEIAPLVLREPRGAWGRLLSDVPLVGALARTRAAARKQLRLRRRLGIGDRPARPLLADFRARCVRADSRGETGGLGALLPDDALPVVVALLDAGGALSFETLLLDLENDRGPLPESLVARAKIVGDLLSALGRHRRPHMEEQG